MEQVLYTGNAITLVHLVSEVLTPPLDEEPEGPPTRGWRIACMPRMEELHQTAYHPNYQRTDDPRAVSCPACKESLAFKTLARGVR